MYIVVSIGNTDNRLSQQEWNRFVEEVIDVIGNNGKVHFFGGPSTWAPWQNVAWIVEANIVKAEKLRNEIKSIRQRYHQDSAFVLIGPGDFV